MYKPRGRTYTVLYMYKPDYLISQTEQAYINFIFSPHHPLLPPCLPQPPPSLTLMPPSPLLSLFHSPLPLPPSLPPPSLPHSSLPPSSLQAYRLEPLVNHLYANIKPVKVDSAGSKHSKDMVDLAQGPRSEEQLQPQSKGWLDTFSQWMTSKKPLSSSNTTDGGKPKPDKVRV